MRMVVCRFLRHNRVLHASSEVCSPVHMLQLLQPNMYPEADAASGVALAHFRVLIYLKHRLLSLACVEGLQVQCQCFS